jgi:hypothetical protein
MTIVMAFDHRFDEGLSGRPLSAIEKTFSRSKFLKMGDETIPHQGVSDQFPEAQSQFEIASHCYSCIRRTTFIERTDFC